MVNYLKYLLLLATLLVFSGQLQALMIVYSCLAEETHHSVYSRMRIKALCTLCVCVHTEINSICLYVINM